MALEVVFRPEAEADLVGLYEYIAEPLPPTFVAVVIASEAKQSIAPQGEKWIASSLRSSQ